MLHELHEQDRSIKHFVQNPQNLYVSSLDYYGLFNIVSNGTHFYLYLIYLLVTS